MIKPATDKGDGTTMTDLLSSGPTSGPLLEPDSPKAHDYME